MSVYVDPLFNTQPYRKSADKRWSWSQACHMTSDTEAELHAMADKLGLKRAWFQNHHRNPLYWHYDITANKRAQAVRLGAVEITLEQWTERIKAQKETAQ